MIRILFSAMCTMLAASSLPAQDTAKPRCFELRTYYAAEGKLEALQKRFRDHTTALFEKHGMTNVGYWLPIENPDQRLIYLLSYPDLDARETAWKAFQTDPEWIEAKAASEVEGTLVKKAESRFLTLTDFSPPMTAPEGVPHTFELRTYTTTPGNLPALLERFRSHTVGLFTKHGMKHFGYFTPADGQPGGENTLIYFLIHDSPEAMKASFAAFRADPEWIAVREASEKKAGGSLTIENGVISEPLIATDFSPVK